MFITIVDEITIVDLDIDVVDAAGFTVVIDELLGTAVATVVMVGLIVAISVVVVVVIVFVECNFVEVIIVDGCNDSVVGMLMFEKVVLFGNSTTVVVGGPCLLVVLVVTAATTQKLFISYLPIR